MLCYVYKPVVSWLNWMVEHGKGKWKYSKGILKICQGNGNSKVAENILPFSFMLRVAERLYNLIFLDDF